MFPISLLLSVLTAFLTFLLGIGTALLYLLMMFLVNKEKLKNELVLEKLKANKLH